MMTTEADVIRAVDAALTAFGIFHWRNNTGAVKYEGTQGKRFVRYGHPGSADILGVCPDGRFLAVECKRPKAPGQPGGRLSALQNEFLTAVNKNGGVGIVVDGVDELEKQLDFEEVI